MPLEDQANQGTINDNAGVDMASQFSMYHSHYHKMLSSPLMQKKVPFPTSLRINQNV